MRKTLIIYTSILVSFLAISRARADNLVTNPGFETGDLTGWAVSGTDSSAADNGVYYGVDTIDAHSGTYGAYFGPVGGVLDLSQALSTSPGATYSVSFWLAQAPSTPAPYTNSFAVSFGGNGLFSQTDLAAGSYTQYSYTATATSASTTLQFAFRDDTGFFSLDDISVSTATPPSAIPEPASWGLVFSFLAAGGMYVARRKVVKN